jgi:hypothetical protein
MDTPYTLGHFAEYCLGRMVGKLGIRRVGVAMSLTAAEARLKELAEACPGRYIVFCRNTGRVVAQTQD